LQLRLLWSIPSAAANIGAVAEVRKRGRGESLRVHLLSLHRGPVTIQSFPFSLVFSSGISRMTALLGVLWISHPKIWPWNYDWEHPPYSCLATTFLLFYDRTVRAIYGWVSVIWFVASVLSSAIISTLSTYLFPSDLVSFIRPSVGVFARYLLRFRIFSLMVFCSWSTPLQLLFLRQFLLVLFFFGSHSFCGKFAAALNGIWPFILFLAFLLLL